MAKDPAIGIDLGTTYSCVAIYEFGNIEIIANDQGNRITPSMVAFTDEERLIGDAAKSQFALNPKNTVYDAKRMIGRRFKDVNIQNDIKQWPFEIISDDYKPMIKVKFKKETKILSPEEISSMVLRKMKEIAEAYLGRSVTNAVITVPAYFNISQRQATKDAATIAGLKVLKIINEPTAAAIAYGLDKNNMTKKSKKNVLIFDLGGGTFDVSIITIKNGKFEVISTDGDTHLGGEDFNNRMINYFIEEFQRKHKMDLSSDKRALQHLRTACDGAKIALSEYKETEIQINPLIKGIDFRSTITRACFEHLNADLFGNTLTIVERALKSAKMNKSQIHDIILIGGSSRIPKIQNMLQTFFDGKDLCRHINPDEAVAYGAAIHAAILNGEESTKLLKGVRLIDVTALSVGIEEKGGLMATMIKRNTPIPTSKSKKFTTIEDNQRLILFRVFEGERQWTKDNNFIGEFALSAIPSAPCAVPNIKVTFDIDQNGILTVSAIDKMSGNGNGITITSNNERLSKAQIDKLIRDVHNGKADDQRQNEHIRAKTSLEEYVLEVKKSVQNGIQENKLNANDAKKVLNKIDATIMWLKDNQHVEKELYERKLNDLEEVYNHFNLNNDNNDQTDNSDWTHSIRTFTRNSMRSLSKRFSRKKK